MPGSPRLLFIRCGRILVFDLIPFSCGSFCSFIPTSKTTVAAVATVKVLDSHVHNSVKLKNRIAEEKYKFNTLCWHLVQWAG